MDKVLTRLRVPLGFAFAAYYLYASRPVSSQAYLLALLLVTLGCALRSWAAGYLLKGKRVAVGGPYAWIRNPLYMGSFLIGSGFCVALWESPLPWPKLAMILVFMIGFGVVYRTKTLAEEKELVAHLGADYSRYAQQVPPFLPTRGRVAGLGEQHFSVELYRRNKEYECILGSLGVLVYLFWKMNYAG